MVEAFRSKSSSRWELLNQHFLHQKMRAAPSWCCYLSSTSLFPDRTWRRSSSQSRANAQTTLPMPVVAPSSQRLGKEAGSDQCLSTCSSHREVPWAPPPLGRRGGSALTLAFTTPGWSTQAGMGKCSRPGEGTMLWDPAVLLDIFSVWEELALNFISKVLSRSKLSPEVHANTAQMWWAFLSLLQIPPFCFFIVIWMGLSYVSL